MRGKDRAFDTDLPEVNMMAVVSKIESMYLNRYIW